MYCPRHNQPMQEVRHGSVNVDVCGYGCMFLDPGEIDGLINDAMASFGVQGHRYQTPPIPAGRQIRDPQAYVFNGFGSHGGHGHGGHRRHHRSSGGFFGSDGIFGSS